MNIVSWTTRASLLAVIVFGAFSVLEPAPAHADHLSAPAPTHPHHSHEQDGDDGLDLRVLLRAGAGSMFGPGFKTGQPVYAREKITESDNQKPFSMLRQSAMTYGTAATVEVGEFGPWNLGGTAVLGFNATAANRGGMTDELDTKEKLQGVTYGGGVRASYGDNIQRVTIDVLATQSHLKGRVEWKEEPRFGSSDVQGHALYKYDLHRFAAMLGYEFKVSGPLYGFLQGGAQFLPGQTTHRRQKGTVPWVSDPGTFEDFEAKQLEKMDREIQFDPELQLAVGAGLGVEF